MIGILTTYFFIPLVSSPFSHRNGSQSPRLSAHNPAWCPLLEKVLQDKLWHLSGLARTSIARDESDLKVGLFLIYCNN